MTCDLVPSDLDKSWKFSVDHISLKFHDPSMPIEEEWIDMFAHDAKSGDVLDYTVMINDKPYEWSLFYDTKLKKSGWTFKDVACWKSFVDKANVTAYEDFAFSISS